jgi:KDO2-lipid IV(A) lauroyltransferase
LAPPAQSNATAIGVRQRAQSASLAAAIFGLQRLPEATARALGENAGRVFTHLETRAHRIARANLEVAFPHLGRAERNELLRAHWMHLGRMAAQWALLPRRSQAELRDRVTIVGLERIQAALEPGRGVLVATAHFGFWELVLPAMRALLPDARVTAVGHPQRNPGLRAQVDLRRRLGGGEVPLRQDAREILRALADGAAIGVLADHRLPARRGGRLAPFFGHAVWTNPGPATLALRAGCPLLSAHTHPLPGGRHRITIGESIQPPATGDRGRDIEQMTARLNATIEEWIRERPELWLWSHARFRNGLDIGSNVYERAGRRRTQSRSAVAATAVRPEQGRTAT